MRKLTCLWWLVLYCACAAMPLAAQDFNRNWKFYPGDLPEARSADFDDQHWRTLDLPHDWGVEGSFDQSHPATFSGGALPGGTGWYRKHFAVPAGSRGKFIAVDFDGVYRNSEVWINGHYLGKRPGGYSSFRYVLSSYLHYGAGNTLAVRVDNASQPNSRWYTGSGIYRRVRLVELDPIHVGHWGTFVSTPVVTSALAKVKIELETEARAQAGDRVNVRHTVYDRNHNRVSTGDTVIMLQGAITRSSMLLEVPLPHLWSDTDPYLYTVVTELRSGSRLNDRYETPLGIRSFTFDAAQGFALNGRPLKIRGVCNHHDLGALGTAFNVSAARRQLELLKAMGCNGLRTAHNPPAPELLDLCDQLGFIVMDEAFDTWIKKKNDFDYHLDFAQWHRRDLEDQVRRDRNHPSVFIWSVGNEIQEQWGTGADTAGRAIALELVRTVKALDSTRPVTSANNETGTFNNLIRSGAFDLIGYNYNHRQWQDFGKTFPGKKLIATETTSALQTRGHYDMPSDSMRIWPVAWDKPLLTGNADLSCSAYDNCYTPWGTTHEATLRAFAAQPQVSGMFVWTGFDYLGEPTPYTWPARSSYFGILDLAGFPKDVYYLYQSVWTAKPVLHIFPHWNWKPGQDIDVWAYYSQADEVELYLNGVSQGKRSKQGDELKVSWKLVYAPGELKAVSRKNGLQVKAETIRTAGPAAAIQLSADRSILQADGKELAYVTVRITDAEGNLVPDAGHKINFKVSQGAAIAGLDNGSPTSHESFRGDSHSAFNGLALVIVKAGRKAGAAELTAVSPGLASAKLKIRLKTAAHD